MHYLVMAGDYYYPEPTSDLVRSAQSRTEVEDIAKHLHKNYDWIVVFEDARDKLGTRIVHRYRFPTYRNKVNQPWEKIDDYKCP